MPTYDSNTQHYVDIEQKKNPGVLTKNIKELNKTAEEITKQFNTEEDIIDNYITLSTVNEDPDLADARQSELIQKMIRNGISGIEGMPYQFMDTVDHRPSNSVYGRKYAEKILTRLPLLFLTPCEPKALADFDRHDVKAVFTQLIEGTFDPDLIEGTGRYYSTEFAYPEYYGYVDVMLAALVKFLGIENETVNINGSSKKLGDFEWSEEANKNFATYFDGAENVIFYLDGFNSVQENFTNDTTESAIASQVNEFSGTANEVKFLLGGSDGSALGKLMDGAVGVVDKIGEALSGVVGDLGGSVLGSFADNGIKTIANGGKIIFPKIWSNSTFNRSYTLSLKFRSPDHDNLSIFMNVLKPYCKLLCLCMPRVMHNGDKVESDNPTTYMSPFLVRAYSKGMFNIDMGIISSLSVAKGGEGMWNDDGLPTQIDVDVEIEDLYSALAMSGYYTNKGIIPIPHPFQQAKQIANIVNNTSYMDFIANMAGLNIGQQYIGRKVVMYNYLAGKAVKQFPSRKYMNFDRRVTQLLGNAYKVFS